MARSTVALIAAALLSAGLIVGGYLLGDGLKRAKFADRAVTVRGLAERDVEADLASWTIRFTAQGTSFQGVKGATAAMAEDVRAFLTAQGFAAAKITTDSLSVNQWMMNGMPQVQIRQAVRLDTDDIGGAARAYAAQGSLLDQGVAIEETRVVYSFTRLTDLKPDMIAEATRDARAAAEQFARDSGATVGAIKSARQGYFSIEPRDGAVGAASSSPEQKVRVVTSVDFYLE
ncbi:MAG: SIMPL domain-containing protein [Pacificimonas sp.]